MLIHFYSYLEFIPEVQIFPVVWVPYIIIHSWLIFEEDMDFSKLCNTLSDCEVQEVVRQG